jgi:hypothetical protein
LENYQFKFNEGDSEGTFDSGNFAINGSTVTLKFNDHNKKDIVLEFSEDHDVQYLTNDQGEYFVHTDDDSAATQTSTDLSSGQKNTIEVTIMVPKDENNYDNYKQAIYKYTDGNGKDPSKTWIFVKKQVIVPYTADVVKASAEAAAGEIPTSGGPDKASIAYLKIKDGTAYVLLDIDEDGWAGVSYTIGYIHPLVEKTLLQFPEIKKVVFNFAPGDNSNSKSISGIIKK